MDEPQFNSPEDWRKWVMERADYYTVITFRPFTRHEFRKLAQARTFASQAASMQGRESEPALIYAVYNTHDCLIEAVNVVPSKYNTT